MDIYCKIDKLNKLLVNIKNKEEERFLEEQQLKFSYHSDFYNFLYEELFPFISKLKNAHLPPLAWKIVFTGVSLYVSSNRKRDGRFMSVDLLADKRIKYEFYQGIQKFDHISLEPGGDFDHCWYYVNGLKLNSQLKDFIIRSYFQKVVHLRDKKGVTL